MHHPPKFARREFVNLAIAAIPALGLTGAATVLAGTGVRAAGRDHVTHSPDEALRRLLAGNARFVRGQPESPRRSPKEFSALAEGQSPQAVILSCADSRVAPEILFDVGLGDIFVVRVAGNVVASASAVVNGSIEYGIEELHVPLIVVLGHSNCGAVKAAMKHIDAKVPLPGAINTLVELIKPAVVRSRSVPGDPLDNAIKANVRQGVERLRGLEPIIAGRVRAGKVKVVGAVYDLRTGKVNLLS